MSARNGAAHDEEAKSYLPVYWFDAKGEDGSNALVQAKLITSSDGQPARLNVIDVFPYGDAVQESRMPRSGDPVASLTGQELGDAADILALGKAASDWYRANLIGQQVTNAETGWDIRFSRKGANKIGGRKGEDLYRIVPALREMIAKGRLVSSEPFGDPDGQTRAFHKFAVVVELAGVVKDVIVSVRESANGRYHYDLSRDVSDGARFSLPSSPVMEAGARGESADAADLNIDFAPPARKPDSTPSGWGEVEADAPITDAAIASVTRDLRACRDHRDSGFPSEVICDSLCGGIYGGQLWASRIL